MTKKIKVKGIKKIKEDPISVRLKLLGVFHEAKGKTIEEALGKLEIPKARGLGVLVVTKGDKTREKVLRSQIVNNTFGQRNPTMKMLGMKNILTLFEDFK